jgi:hypothetical protein
LIQNNISLCIGKQKQKAERKNKSNNQTELRKEGEMKNIHKLSKLNNKTSFIFKFETKQNKTNDKDILKETNYQFQISEFVRERREKRETSSF